MREQSRQHKCLVSFVLGCFLTATFAAGLQLTGWAAQERSQSAGRVPVEEDKTKAAIEAMQKQGLLHHVALLTARIEKLEATYPRYEIQEAKYDGSGIMDNPTVSECTEKLVGTKQFSRKVKRVWVAISGIDTWNNNARPVYRYYFTGHGEVDPADRTKVKVYISHHMSDGVAGAGDKGSIRVLLIGEVE
jgi:hypothetical protein